MTGYNKVNGEYAGGNHHLLNQEPDRSLLSDDPSWDKGWIGSRAGEGSTQGGVR